MTNTFTITVPVMYWYDELQDYNDENVLLNYNDDNTVTMYCHDVPDELIQGMNTAELVEWYGVDPEFVICTNHEDLK